MMCGNICELLDNHKTILPSNYVAVSENVGEVGGATRGDSGYVTPPIFLSSEVLVSIFVVYVVSPPLYGSREFEDQYIYIYGFMSGRRGRKD
jgi:hypothetical protein